jgi:hypothetical protein
MVVPATTTTVAAVTWAGDSMKQCNNHIDNRWHLTLVDLLHYVIAFSFRSVSLLLERQC